jgi:hypothetical protein
MNTDRKRRQELGFRIHGAEPKTERWEEPLRFLVVPIPKLRDGTPQNDKTASGAGKV